MKSNRPLSPQLLRAMDAYWRAANYLSVGQIYLYENPLLRRPLRLEHIKPRLLGHWGTTPGLNFIYVHLNRVIKDHDLNVLYVTGPGHGGPGIVANAYLEGTYSEVYPNISQDEHGLKRLFKQFSFPGGIPSHVAPETPGSIHEGGELGYSLSHAFGAAFDNPALVVACVIGEGGGGTGPLATGWHGNKFLNPKYDGAVLPILHLNGYKIANPTVLARIERADLEALLRGYGYLPYFVEGDDPEPMHQLMAATLDRVVADIRQIQSDARTRGVVRLPRWPMIVLKTPKGWTGPRVVDGEQVEGTFRMFGPDETASNRLTAVLEASAKQWLAEVVPGDDHLAPEGRVIEVLSEHQCEGWLEGYVLTGRHGLFNCYEAFVHIIDSMFNQHAKWLDVTRHIAWRRPIASLNILLSSHVWRQDHNGFTHQDPGFIDLVMNKKAEIIRVYLPPDANCLLSVMDHCLRSRHYVNVVVAGKHPAPQWLPMDEAVRHCGAGIGTWEWASSAPDDHPDVVMACP